MAKLTRRKARLILHHGEVRGYPLTEPQRRFFGARASGYPRRNAMAARFCPVCRSRPHLAGCPRKHGTRHYRHNPGKGGGMNWMPILLIGGAAFFLLPRLTGAGGMFGAGTSVLPAGYTYLGSGFYRGPDGQTYYRSPTTGQMTPATTQQVMAAQAQQVGTSFATAIIPTATTAITSLFGGLVKSLGGAFQTDQQPLGSPAGTVEGDILGTGASSGGYSDVLRSGGEVGIVPAPLPEFPELTYSWPADESYYQDYYAAYEQPSYEMTIDLAPAPVSVESYDESGWF